MGNLPKSGKLKPMEKRIKPPERRTKSQIFLKTRKKKPLKLPEPLEPDNERL